MCKLQISRGLHFAKFSSPSPLKIFFPHTFLTHFSPQATPISPGGKKKGKYKTDFLKKSKVRIHRMIQSMNAKKQELEA